ncbi:hypothetical protein [uncultured Brevundimonas sp.]|uniref:hypothetical protein n=1 Tax=uncultured Brevundimonas sp. TaxID=213418 RepID=UPI0030EC1827|tara:strand:- start:84237 stop:84671 length:435 start_codon:yes stop_codon:yes gene_type:complete
MSWRDVLNRLGARDDFAVFVLRDTNPTGDNLKRVSDQVFTAIEQLGYKPIDPPFTVDGLYMAVFDFGVCELTVGLSEDETATWLLHIQLPEQGILSETYNHRLTISNRLAQALHKVLSARADLVEIEWFQGRKFVRGQGATRPR